MSYHVIAINEGEPTIHNINGALSEQAQLESAEALISRYQSEGVAAFMQQDIQPARAGQQQVVRDINDQPTLLVITSPEAVKAEARRRILAIIPEWKQMNLTAKGALLAVKGQANWTPEEQAEYDEGLVIWQQVDAIRSRSDELEALLADDDTIDIFDDGQWVTS